MNVTYFTILLSQMFDLFFSFRIRPFFPHRDLGLRYNDPALTSFRNAI